MEQKRDLYVWEKKATDAEESVSDGDRQRPTGWSEKDPLHLSAGFSTTVPRQK